MCKKQTAVSHSSTDYEVKSFDAGLRMDGTPLLILGILFLKYDTLHHTIPAVERLVAMQTQCETRPNGSASEDFGLTEFDYFTRNAKLFSRQCVALHF